MNKLWITSLAGILIQPLIFACWPAAMNLLADKHIEFRLAEFIQYAPAVIAVSALPVLLIGVSTFWCLLRLNRLNWFTAAVAGFVAGIALGEVIAPTGSVDQFIHLALGAHGLAAAMAMYATWRGMLSNPLLQRTATPPAEL
jgi:hypothetical protein